MILRLNVASNRLSAFGHNGVKLEVSAFDPGRKPLFADYRNPDCTQNFTAWAGKSTLVKKTCPQ
ncbi:MAG: hypothetical protein ACYDDO_07410 [Acidiferrobacterales bacterium]